MADVQNDYNTVRCTFSAQSHPCLCYWQLTRSPLLSSPSLFSLCLFQTEGEPTVRIGNWVEQRALLTSTGYTRGALVHSATGQLLPPDTYARTVQHVPADSPDWLTSTQRDHLEGLRDRTRTAAPLPSRAALRAAAVRAAALARVEEEERRRRGEEEKEMYDSLYAHKPAVNRRRALGDGQGGGLDDLPITHASSTRIHGAMREDVAASRTIRASGLHGKHTAFSVPITESRGGPHHQLGL